jgi:hypothetical protein
MPTPVSLIMYVQPGTLPPVPPKCRLSDDPNRQTPLLTLITVVDNAPSDSGTYSTIACQAVCAITAAEWTHMCTLINDHSHQVQVTIVYDSSAAGSNKPLIGGPVFTAVPPLQGGLIAQVANAIHAAEERVESGVSGDVRDDIKNTRSAVTEIKALLDAIKAKVDTL